MAYSHYVGQVVPNEEDYFWKNDVINFIQDRTPQEQFASCLKFFLSGKITFSQHNNGIFLHATNGLWLHIDNDGRIEFGEAAA
jgi:hypothetical protein